MNRLKLVLLVLSPFFLMSQSQRTVLMEEFTQASCPPCEATTPALNARLAQNEDKVVQIRYQVSWPGRDPMNEDNPVEVGTRRNYYEVSSVPYVVLDGSRPLGSGNELLTQSAINTAYAKSAPLLLELDHEIAADLKTITVSAKVSNEGSTTYNNPDARLLVAIIEEDIVWDQPPGSTSITVFEAVFKSFIGGNDGHAIPSISGGEFANFIWTDFELPTTIYNGNKVSVVAFIQDTETREMINAADTEPQVQAGPYVDIAFEEFVTSSFRGNLCNPIYTTELSFINNSSSSATNPVFTINIPGENNQSIPLGGQWNAGESLSYQAVLDDLPVGVSVVSFSMDTDALDLNSNNSNSPRFTYYRISEDLTDEMNDDFEDIEEFYGNYAIDVTSMIFPVTPPQIGGELAGAFGLSENSVVVNFFRWNPAERSEEGFLMPVQKIEIPPDGGQLTFDHAHARYESSNDALAIEVSTDCGETYTELWRQQGEQLATAPATTDIFIPTATQWRTSNVDLASMAGQTVHIRFALTSDFGNTLFIDNFSVQLNIVDNDNDGSPAHRDCNDNDPNVYPGAAESCNNQDDDCDGQVDEGLALITYYHDNDGDGFGDASISLSACAAPVNYVTDSSDCDDSNPNINPSQAETTYNGIDDDCNEQTKDDDLDGDGFVLAEDCDDNNAMINPNATDLPDNGIDENCDGVDATVYVDSDGDGSTNQYDCNDGDPNIYPGAPEICNNKDDNCDGAIDEGLTYTTYYQDNDGDGYGNANAPLSDCIQPFAYVLDATDCDDTNPMIYPTATETCDGIDNNCDNNIDEGLAQQTYYEDQDGDGYGNADVSLTDCKAITGYILNSEDCNDNDPNINPGMTESCNEIDDNCNGEIDEDVTEETYYKDEDGDGYGDPDDSLVDCQMIIGYVLQAGDCNDTDPNINPDAEENCNQQDDNCDGNIDEDLVYVTYYSDMDMDGYGDDNSGFEDCLQPPDTTTEGGDCDDSNPNIYPGAEEIVNNGIDEDCDGMDLTSAVKELAGQSVSIFPNPFTTAVTVLSNHAGLTYSVFSINGKTIIAHQKLNGDLDLSELDSGMYLLQIKTASGSDSIIELINKS